MKAILCLTWFFTVFFGIGETMHAHCKKAFTDIVLKKTNNAENEEIKNAFNDIGDYNSCLDTEGMKPVTIGFAREGVAASFTVMCLPEI